MFKFNIGDVVRINAENLHHKRIKVMPDQLKIVRRAERPRPGHNIYYFEGLRSSQCACEFRLEHEEGPW